MGNNIYEVDTNFKTETTIEREGLKFYDPECEPFEIYGIFREGDRFRRMPEAVAKSVSNGVYLLHANTSGGRVRFITDSPYVAISAKMDNLLKIHNFAFTGSIGFDMYADNNYVATFAPPFDITDGYEMAIDLPTREKRVITIDFPLYSDVKKLYIGLKEDAYIAPPPPYKNEKPLVYYGSSITQGGCASRAGMAYEAIISRRLNLDYVALGFSGAALGEDEMCEYLKSLEMSVFVMDYDHNASNPEHLVKTHEKLFKAIREKYPDMPIIIMARPKFDPNENDRLCSAVVEKTYKNAIAAGDKNVYFLSGKDLMALCGNEGTVEGLHPTDYGFVSMAKAVGDILEKL